MNGFFLVDKPEGKTSSNVVLNIKRKLNLKKCGHNGTLDPNTTGLMVVGCNEATKLMKFINEHDKAYITTIVFGYDSNTLDIYGNITEDFKMDFSNNDLEEALEKIKEQTKQIPPMVSAIKVDGRKLYELERKNINVDIEARDIKIYSITKLSDLKEVDGHLEIDLIINCSKGFYVRSFARDLGAMLGGKAIMKKLRRIRSGNFNIQNSIPLDEIASEHLISIEEMFPDFDRLNVNDYIAKLALNGVVFDERQIKTDKPFYVLHKNEIIAIYEPVDEFKYKPVIIFKK